MYNRYIIDIKPLGFMWPMRDPFLFCAHHKDFYPAGNDQLGPAASLSGRNIGQDFSQENPWRMYHGDVVPGFPAHPHRGFETITIVLTGFVDHSDSHGAAGRYGNGDVQWMTAGSGLQHAEMFPLIHQDSPNPLELFQVWLNLPQKDKFTDPFYKMLWAEDIPNLLLSDDDNHKIEIRIIAGQVESTKAPKPAPNSWAADPINEVAIWHLKMDPGANWELPLANQPVNRTLYFFKGDTINIAGLTVPAGQAIELLADEPVALINGNQKSEMVLLQGVPIGEPVMQHGPFVMNTREEIRQAIYDFHQTQFGGWPWSRHDNVHQREMGRFAYYADSTKEVR